METTKTPEIFVSYCHKNADLINQIETGLMGLPMYIRRDIRDIDYRSSIKDYVSRIR